MLEGPSLPHSEKLDTVGSMCTGQQALLAGQVHRVNGGLLFISYNDDNDADDDDNDGGYDDDGDDDDMI